MNSLMDVPLNPLCVVYRGCLRLSEPPAPSSEELIQTAASDPTNCNFVILLLQDIQLPSLCYHREYFLFFAFQTTMIKHSDPPLTRSASPESIQGFFFERHQIIDRMKILSRERADVMKSNSLPYLGAVLHLISHSDNCVRNYIDV